jgi:hypothetical protein
LFGSFGRFGSVAWLCLFWHVWFSTCCKVLACKSSKFCLATSSNSCCKGRQRSVINRCQVSAPGRVPWIPVVVHGCAVPRGVVVDYPCIHRVYPYHFRQRRARPHRPRPLWTDQGTKLATRAHCTMMRATRTLGHSSASDTMCLLEPMPRTHGGTRSGLGRVLGWELWGLALSPVGAHQNPWDLHALHFLVRECRNAHGQRGLASCHEWMGATARMAIPF